MKKPTFPIHRSASKRNISMTVIGDYVPPVTKSPEVIEVKPAVELCTVCHHLKYKAVKHIDGSSYTDRKRCMNCPTCKEVRNGKRANAGTGTDDPRTHEE